MVDLLYRVYGYRRGKGWELIDVMKKESDEEIDKEIRNIDGNEYERYIVIKQLRDRDEIYECGVLDMDVKKKKLTR